MVALKDISTVFSTDDIILNKKEKDDLLRLSETVLNHIIETNCYNDLDELDLSVLTLLIEPGRDSISLIEKDSQLPLYPPEKISIWKKLLQS